MHKLPATTSTTTYNPIAPHHASSAWGVVSVLVLLVILVAVAAIVWLFVSYGQHLRDHQLHQDQPDDTPV